MGIYLDAPNGFLQASFMGEKRLENKVRQKMRSTRRSRSQAAARFIKPSRTQNKKRRMAEKDFLPPSFSRILPIHVDTTWRYAMTAAP
jgi:hypothetical protein